MRLNWRARAAKIHVYYDTGEFFVQKVKTILVIGAALKLWGVPTKWTLLSIPLVLIAHVVAGYLWVKVGWYRQTQEVALIDTWSPLQIWQLWMTVRIIRRLGVEANHCDLRTLPEEVQAILASSRSAP